MSDPLPTALKLKDCCTKEERRLSNVAGFFVDKGILRHA